MKIFISGKITGEPVYECCEKFKDAKKSIEASYTFMEYKHPNPLKTVAITPTVIDPLSEHGIYFGISHKEAMKVSKRSLKNCDAIYMLKDWKQSKGSKMEHKLAKENNLKVYYQ